MGSELEQSAVEAADGDRPSEAPAALSELVRSSARHTVVGLVVLLALLALSTKLFEAQLFAATSWVFQTIGAPGLAGLIMLADGIVSPVPPDLVLIAVAKSELDATSRWVLVGQLGLVSVVAGNLGFLLSAKLRGTTVPDRIFGRMRGKSERLVRRFGGVAIAVGALTPVPYSITCWAGGLLGLSWRVLAPMTLLRIPRFFAYYWAISSVDGWIRGVGG